VYVVVLAPDCNTSDASINNAAFVFTLEVVQSPWLQYKLFNYLYRRVILWRKVYEKA